MAVAAAALAAPAGAQESPRYTLRAHVNGTAVYDDNIYFEREDREDGVGMRFRPGVDGSFRATRDLSFDASFASEADFYPGQPELNDLFASQSAGLAGHYRLDTRTGMTLAGQYSRSSTSADLISGTGLEFGRVAGTSWGFQAGATRRMSAGGSLAFNYSHQTVSFEDLPETVARSISVGWNQQLTERTSLSLSAGPRFVDDGTSTEAIASIQHRIEHGSLSLGYARSRYPAPGREVDVESLSGSLQIALSRSVQLSASPGLFRHRFGDSAQSRAWRVVAGASWQVRPGLSARAVYQHMRQDGRPELNVVFRDGPWISRNTLAISFSAGFGRPRGERLQPGVGPVGEGPVR